MATKILAIEEQTWFSTPTLLREIALRKEFNLVPSKEGIEAIKEGGIFYDFHSINGGLKSYKYVYLLEANFINVVLYNKENKDKLIKNAEYEGFLIQFIEGEKIPSKDIETLLKTGKAILLAEELKKENKYIV